MVLLTSAVALARGSGGGGGGGNRHRIIIRHMARERGDVWSALFTLAIYSTTISTTAHDS